MSSKSHLVGVLAAVASLFAMPANAADKITFVTDFGYLGRHAYYFVALDKGYYSAAGLDVNIVRGQGSADAVKQVAAGSAELGFADSAAVILGRGNDNVPVKMVSMIYAKAPHAIFALKDSGITTPKDLEGRSIADAPNSAMPRLFKAYAEAAGIDAAKVKWTIVSSDAIPATLALGRADAVGYYSISEALLKKATGGKELVQLKYADAGMDFYSNGIIASERILKEKPDVVRRFVEATWHGLRDAIADPEEAAKILNKHHHQIDVDVGAAEVRAVAGLVDEAQGGKIDEERMQHTVDIVAGAYDMKSPVKATDIFAPGFTGDK
jgi:NitT/TauT family transport system substrate-binding protein